jgi:hypothetical protein
MATTSDIRRVGETLKTQVGDAIDQAAGVVSGAARDASEAVRGRASDLADRAQDFYDDLEGEDAGAKLRGVVAQYPLVSVAIAVVAGIMIGRALRD